MADCSADEDELIFPADFPFVMADRLAEADFPFVMAGCLAEVDFPFVMAGCLAEVDFPFVMAGCLAEVDFPFVMAGCLAGEDELILPGESSLIGRDTVADGARDDDGRADAFDKPRFSLPGGRIFFLASSKALSILSRCSVSLGPSSRSKIQCTMLRL